MSKKLLSLVLVLMMIVASVFVSACNQTEDTPQYSVGISVSGKVVIDGTPAPNVKVLIDGGGNLVTDENGIFVATDLDKYDVITFDLDGYVFYPEKVTVTQDIYDLRIEGFCSSTTDDDVVNDTPSNDDNDNNNPDSDDNTEDENTEDDNDSTVIDDRLYNVTNTGLLFENGVINLVFCVDKGFSSLSVILQTDDVSTPVAINTNDIVCEEQNNSHTLVQYKVDVTALLESSCSFCLSALNNKGQTGLVGQVDFAPLIHCQEAVIEVKDNTLHLTSYDLWARNYLMINGVVVDEIFGGSVDLSSYRLYQYGTASVAVLSLKSGALPAYSNLLYVNFEEVNYDPQ